MAELRLPAPPLLRKLCTEARLTQEELAKAALGQRLVSGLEREIAATPRKDTDRAGIALRRYSA